MEAIFDFPAILREARELFNSRSRAVVPLKEKKNYRVSNNPPKFSFGIKANKVVCVWLGNFKKGREGRPKKDGTCTVFSIADIMAPFRYSELEIREGFTSREWDRIGLELIHLHEQLSGLPRESLPAVP
jgi:hypothetical protein